MDILVLCVDRDDDIGKKAGLKGPIVGIDDNIKAANQLAIIDPQDTDVNAIFAAVKLVKEADGKVEVATIVGDADRGIKADAKLSKQLDQLIEEFKPGGVILVTDGKDDEQILPIVSSRVKIISVHTVVVRQSQELEKAYFTALNFLNEILSEPRIARLVIGLPGIVLVILASAFILCGIYNIPSVYIWIALIGFVGIYLFLKGFGLEELALSYSHRFIISFSTERIALLAYFIAGVVTIVGLYMGYTALNIYSVQNPGADLLEKISAFILGSFIFFLLAISVAIGGRIYDNYVGKNYLQLKSYIITLALMLLIIVILRFGAEFVLGIGGIDLMALTIVFAMGIVFFIAVIDVTNRIFGKRIGVHEKVRQGLLDREVYDTNGNYMGKVLDVLIENYKVTGIMVEDKMIPKSKIKSSGEVIIVSIK